MKSTLQKVESTTLFVKSTLQKVESGRNFLFGGGIVGGNEKSAHMKQPPFRTAVDLAVIFRCPLLLCKRVIYRIHRFFVILRSDGDDDIQLAGALVYHADIDIGFC